MASKTSSKSNLRTYLIWASVLTIITVSSIAVWRRSKNKKLKEECSKNGGVWDDVSKTCAITPKVEEKPSVVPTPPIGLEFAATGLSKEDGNAFRKWVNEKYPEYAKKIDLSLTGNPDNLFIRKAFAQYGTEWKSSKTGSTTILPTNADLFTKLAAALNTPIYIVSDGRRRTDKKFTIKDVGTFDLMNKGTWKIEFYEQSSSEPSKQSFRIIDGLGAEFNMGYWSNNGKTLVVKSGKNKGTSSTTDSLSKSIKAIVGKDIVLS